MFGLRRPPLRYFSNFPEFLGRRGWLFKLQSQIYSITVLANFKFFIFEERTFLPFTSNCNNNCLNGENQRKKPVETTSIIVRKTGN